MGDTSLSYHTLNPSILYWVYKCVARACGISASGLADLTSSIQDIEYKKSSYRIKNSTDAEPLPGEEVCPSTTLHRLSYSSLRNDNPIMFKAVRLTVIPVVTLKRKFRVSVTLRS